MIFSDSLQEFRMECFEVIFQRPHVMVGRIKDSDVYFCISDVGCIKTIWYYNNTSEPCASDEITFEQVLDILGERIADEFIFKINLFKSKKYIYNTSKE